MYIHTHAIMCLHVCMHTIYCVVCVCTHTMDIVYLGIDVFVPSIHAHTSPLLLPFTSTNSAILATTLCQ